MKYTLASTYGFCSGVKNAIKIVNDALKQYPNKKIYLLNKIVHNDFVCSTLEKQGVITLDDNRSLKEKIDSLDDGVIIFSAHGHDKKLDSYALNKGLIIIDAACPRVNLNHESIIKSLNNKQKVVYIGIKNHPETNAALSISEDIIFIDFKNPDYSLIKPNDSISIHNQTTLIQSSLNDINNKIKSIAKEVNIVNDICFATSKRQNCLSEIVDEDLIIIIGDKISSNSTRLYEVAKNNYPQCDAYQVSSLDDLKEIDFSKYKKGFISAGASTPDELINPILKYINSL